MTEARRYNGALAADSPDRKRNPSQRYGKPPLAEQNPRHLAIIHAGPEEWHLTQVRANIGSPGKRHPPKAMPPSDWVNCKLHVIGAARHKANYWVSISWTQKRISARWDTHALLTVRPDLHEAIGAIVRRWDADLEDLRIRATLTNGVWVCEDIPSPEEQLRVAKAQLSIALRKLPVGMWINTSLDVTALREIKAGLALNNITIEANNAPQGGIDVTRLS